MNKENKKVARVVIFFMLVFLGLITNLAASISLRDDNAVKVPLLVIGFFTAVFSFIFLIGAILSLIMSGKDRSK
ncbi:hypothetical protein [Rufibacter roseolus]|uniref:hypothetical protein n=1 Tax=Rufibacter roseolus TaxID=2817375 RepID=UPI001B31559D|nr:hypothetical protein [Rufibacter roseolus]